MTSTNEPVCISIVNSTSGKHTPALRASAATAPVDLFPVRVALIENLDAHQPLPGDQLVFSVTEDGAACRWDHDTSALGDSSIAAMISQFEAFVAGAAASPGRPVAELPLISEAERHRLITEWSPYAPPQRSAAV